MNTNCPACGAPVRFLFAQSVQTVCEYCHSVLVRRDVNLEKVGQVAAVPEDASPIQLGTEGVYRGKSFQVAGRIIYDYELGSWNEWHLAFADNTSGWLSDAMLDYAVTFPVAPQGPLPPQPSGLERGYVLNQGGVLYEVTSVTNAHYRTVQGEFPFVYWDKEDVVFVDLRTPDARFATVDYSESPPLLFAGEAVQFDSLQLKNLREFEGWHV